MIRCFREKEKGEGKLRRAVWFASPEKTWVVFNHYNGYGLSTLLPNDLEKAPQIEEITADEAIKEAGKYFAPKFRQFCDAALILEDGAKLFRMPNDGKTKDLPSDSELPDEGEEVEVEDSEDHSGE